MPGYLIVWHETDGNDCTVFDTPLVATNDDEALKTLYASWEEHYGADIEDAGCDPMGADFPCDCTGEHAEFCEGHGGLQVREVLYCGSYEDAWQARSAYHQVWEV